MLLAVFGVAACVPLACWSHTSSSLLHSNLRKHCGISVNHLPLQCHAAAVGWEAAPRRGGWADTPQRRWLRMRCCCWTIWGGRQAPAGRLICLMRWYGTTAWPARWSNFFQDLWRRDGVEKCSRHPSQGGKNPLHAHCFACRTKCTCWHRASMGKSLARWRHASQTGTCACRTALCCSAVAAVAAARELPSRCALPSVIPACS